ncbi:MAG: HAD hydrolase-like protein [Calditrichaeota bacterium]|nr:HAD hydrolase-like protein [Calditrichota bacterium]
MTKSDRKLLLFDIDGTLILTGGRAGRLMLRCVEQEVNQRLVYSVRDFVGFTDRYIIRNLLLRAGVSEDQVEAAIDRVIACYLDQLAGKLAAPNAIRVLPGVRELLDRLSRNGQYALGLVTGNVKEGARIKLSPVGLFKYFPVGAFGDDAMERSLLPPIAISRAEAHFGTQFRPENIWIIGDSPNDVRCAKANGLRSLAVASGVIPADELAAMQPDALLTDLSCVETVLDIVNDSRPFHHSQIK